MPTQPRDTRSLGALFEQAKSDLPDASLYVLGTGPGSYRNLNLEHIAILSVCNIVFGFFDVSHLKQLAGSFHYDFYSLDYPPLRERSAIYRDAAAAIASAALTKAPVALAAHGSPIHQVFLTHLLAAWGHQEGLRVHVAPNVSSVDSIIAFLGCDDSYGTQSFDATHMVTSMQSPEVSSHCFIMNLEAMLTSRSSVNALPIEETMRPLRDYLLQFYPADHKVHSVFIASDPARHKLSTTRLVNLPSLVHQGAPLGTLYVPPIQLREPQTPSHRVGSLTGLVAHSRSTVDAVLADLAHKVRTGRQGGSTFPSGSP